jgi:hypothetical protein
LTKKQASAAKCRAAPLRLAERALEGRYCPAGDVRQQNEDYVMSYYVDHCPRGFANERIVRKFATKAARQSWLDAFDHDDVNANAEAIGYKEAMRLAGYRGDDATESFNSIVDMSADDD